MAERAAARRPLGRLYEHRVQARTLRLYRLAVSRYLEWAHSVGLPSATDDDDLDSHCMHFLEHCWATGGDRTSAGHVLSGICFALRRRRILTGSWGLFRTWGRLELPRRAPPMPQAVLLAMAGVAFSWQVQDVSLLLILAFSGFLRTMEALTLHRWQVVPDKRGGRLLLHLPFTKSGARRGVVENVVISDSTVVAAVERLLPLLPEQQPLLCRSKHEYRRVFKALLEACGVADHGFQPYSLRRGGATTHLATHGNLAMTVEMGRWADARTGRVYLTSGLQILHELSMSDELGRRHAELASPLLTFLAA